MLNHGATEVQSFFFVYFVKTFVFFALLFVSQRTRRKNKVNGDSILKISPHPSFALPAAQSTLQAFHLSTLLQQLC